MTFLYWILKQTAPRTGRVYFGDIRLENEENIPVGEPIVFVANHPSSLMDPIVCGGYISVPIHFLGRADLFKAKPVAKFLRSAHMWPIYRDVDGKDSLSKNEKVFNECYQSLKEGNPILLYGEGFTDEKFIRRVKKIKKGAARIAMGAEESFNFELDLKIVPVGINYTNPEKLGGDLLLRFAEPIALKDYKEEFEESHVKSLLSITREIEERLLKQVVHVERAEDADSFENVLMLFENTMHYTKRAGASDLVERWTFSKQLADKFNAFEDDKRKGIFDRVNAFWKKVNLKEKELYITQILEGKSVQTTGDLLLLILGFPIALIGLIVNFPLFYLLKNLPQKLTKRITFYAGMKVAIGTFVTPILLSLEYLIFSIFIYIPYLYPAVLIGGILTGICTVKYLELFRRFKNKKCAIKRIKGLNEQELKEEFESLRKSILS